MRPGRIHKLGEILYRNGKYIKILSCAAGHYIFSYVDFARKSIKSEVHRTDKIEDGDARGDPMLKKWISYEEAWKKYFRYNKKQYELIPNLDNLSVEVIDG